MEDAMARGKTRYKSWSPGEEYGREKGTLPSSASALLGGQVMK